MENHEAISSVLFARDDGREVMLLQAEGGTWVNRVTDAEEDPGVVRRITRDSDGRVVSDEREDLDYDPRKRPWFREAMVSSEHNSASWTSPYLFFTTHEPGITASILWNDEDGHSYVLAYDVLLRDLSSAVQQIDLSRYGFAALLTEDGRVVSAPRLDEQTPVNVHDVLMKPVAEIGVEPLANAFAAWQAAGSHGVINHRLVVGGVPWMARIAEYPLKAHGLCMVTMAPADYMSPSGARTLLVVLPLAVLLIGIGAFFAARLADRIGEPLDRLASESVRIGNLDFSEPPSIETDWSELERLQAAHQKMRDLLRGATEELGKAKQELEVRVEERTRDLVAANAELAAFSYAVSHDLRSPLRSINGYCHILESEHGGDWSDSERELMERIRANSSRMGELIDGLLGLARLSARALRMEECDLAAIASEVFSELQRGDSSRDVTVHVESVPEAYGDPALLRDVIANLLGNAWKYTSRTQRARIEFRSVERDGQVFFAVSDNGPGFDMNHATHLFSPFRRMHTESEFPGTGVGLATVRRILELHGGTILAESSPGNGATFYFTLPLAPGAFRERLRPEFREDPEQTA